MKRKTLKIASIILTVIMLCSTLCGFTFNASAEETAIPPTRVIDGKEFYKLLQEKIKESKPKEKADNNVIFVQ